MRNGDFRSTNANREENIAMAKFQNKSKVTSDIAKRSLRKRLYSTRNGDFWPCNLITYLKKGILIWENCYQVNGKKLSQKEALLDKKW